MAEFKDRKTHVRVVSRAPKTALVEWDSGKGLRRATVPAHEVSQEGDVSRSVLDAGLPHGVAWEDVKLTGFPARDLAEALRVRGIWTADDLSRNQRAALGVLQSLYGISLATLNVFAREAPAARAPEPRATLGEAEEEVTNG